MCGARSANLTPVPFPRREGEAGVELAPHGEQVDAQAAQRVEAVDDALIRNAEGV
jgi:hypothetical protein